MPKTAEREPQVSPPSSAAPAPPSPPAPSLVSDLLRIVTLYALSGLALCWIFPPGGLWPLAFVCLAPWAFATCVTRRAWLVHWLSFLTGWALFLWSLRWLEPVTGIGYAALGFYLALYWTLAAWVIRTGRRHGVSVIWTLPVAWTACEYLRAWVMTGFPWLFLSHALYEQLLLIQISDLVGAYGVTFLAAMVNGVLVELALRYLRRPRETRHTLQFVIGIGVTAALLGGVLAYGAYRLGQVNFADDPAVRGPRVAVVQENFIVSNNPRENADPRLILASYLVRAAEAAQLQPELVVFPETAWQAVQNTGYLNADPRALEDDAGHQPYSRRCDAAIAALARGDYAAVNEIIGQLESVVRLQARTRPDLALPHDLPRIPFERGPAVHVVVGSLAIDAFPESVYPKVKKYNSALVYDPDGRQRSERYDKRHLVPFGEIVPFRYGRLHWLYRQLNKLSPFSRGGTYEYSLAPGENLTIFELPYDARTTRFGAPICYEDVMPYVIRDFVWSGWKRRADFLLNISNDGWFRHGNELPQHLAICAYRAVENRVGIARAVNTGISAFIDPNGRVYARVQHDGRDYGPGVAGYEVRPVYLDRRVSLYGRYGDWFAGLCLLLATLLWLDAVIARWVLAIRIRLARWFSRRVREAR